MSVFPVYSTSLQTAAIARVNRVLARSKAARNIASGGVFNCRVISGTSTYSQHAYGNAVDLFPSALYAKVEYHGDVNAELHAIADAVVLHTTKRTIANRGRKLSVSQVIDHNHHRIWTHEDGWHYYDGATGAHVHVSGAPLRTGKPACSQ